MSSSLCVRTEIITIIWKNEKRQPVNSAALMSKKMKLPFDPLFLAEKASGSKMTKQAPESNDCHAIVVECRL